MRSRYSAFAKNEVDYLRETIWPTYQKHFDKAGYLDRVTNSIWLGLEIHETIDGLENQTRGFVTFTAKSMTNGEIVNQTEKSLFKKKNGKWYYVRAV